MKFVVGGGGRFRGRQLAGPGGGVLLGLRDALLQVIPSAKSHRQEVTYQRARTISVQGAGNPSTTPGRIEDMGT